MKGRLLMARALILYFSQGGHTKGLAERLSEKLRENGITSDMMAVPWERPADLSDYRLIFIGTPLYYGREPLIWKDYISKLPDMSGKPGFLFSTYGAEGTKRPDRFMAENLKQYFWGKGLKLLSNHGITCEDTWPPLKKLGYGQGRPDRDDLDGFDKYIGNVLNEWKTGRIDRAMYDVSIRLEGSKVINFLLGIWLRIVPKPAIDVDKCIKCQACIKSCPAGNIEAGSTMRIGPRCIKCMECERICTHGAVRTNWALIDKMMHLYAGKKK
ncbi:MAG: 4Fe-4S binding protein [Clostridiaceae bacterium]|jgi:flavodoxin/NAD-dependent dihydropyrimidine dehydrogenase PreA subunit|nr:4Fe-4S binding protein [Clostridiaceae bacterium]